MDGITKFGILLAIFFFIYLRTQDKEFKVRRKQFKVEISEGNISSNYKSIESLNSSISLIDEEIVRIPSNSENDLNAERKKSKTDLFTYLFFSMPLMLFLMIHAKLAFLVVSNAGAMLRERMSYLSNPEGGININMDSSLSVIQKLSDFITDMPNYYLSFEWFEILGLIAVSVVSIHVAIHMIREVVILREQTREEYEAIALNELVDLREYYKGRVEYYKKDIKKEKIKLKNAKYELKKLVKS